VGTNVLINRVAIDRAITVESLMGPEVTIIQGYQVPGTTNGDGAIRTEGLRKVYGVPRAAGRFSPALRNPASGGDIARRLKKLGDGAAKRRGLEAPEIHVINAGDGRHAHPTQALLDMFTIRHYKKEFHNLRVAIVGDMLHSRVARSQIHALTTLGVPEVRVIAPKTLLPAMVENLGVQVYHDMTQGLRDVDVVLMLRLQKERMQGAALPSAQEYFKYYGLTEEKLARAKPDAIVMHPGPMNRGIEIDSSVADGPRSVIMSQVTFGIAVRMAVMSMLAGAK